MTWLPPANRFRPHLGERLDGDLPHDTLAAVDAHVAVCAACAGLLHDLEQIRSAARSLGPVQPPAHLWIEIAGRVRADAHDDAPAVQPRPVGGPHGALWQWVGLAAALVLVTVVVFGVRRWTAPAAHPTAAAATTTASNADGTGSVQTFEDELKQAQDHYDKAISELEAITTHNEGAIDPAVAATLQKNLTTIDRAIAESRVAVSAHPESEPARASLFDALRQKVDVLQATVTLINEMRNGDQEGAARTAAGIGRKS